MGVVTEISKNQKERQKWVE